MQLDIAELVAPREMRFYDKDWNYVDTRSHFAKEIESITQVKADYLRSIPDLSRVCIAAKTRVADRITTREEDLPCALIGLLATIGANVWVGRVLCVSATPA